MTSWHPPELNGSGTNKHYLKTQIRAELLKKRRLLTLEQKSTSEQLITKQVTNLKEWQKASKIGVYWPICSELSTITLINQIITSPKLCYLPKIHGENMGFVRFNGLVELEPNPLGFHEPKGDISNDKIDIIILPAVGLSQDGQRIGYGKGFYDKYLKNSPALRVGIGYRCQEFSAEIHEEWDQKCDYVLFA